MAKILLIETSTEVCSVAISVDGKVVSLSEEQNPPSHAALLTLQIAECTRVAGLPLAQLDAVAVSRGPGAYTALRVGASVAKGICFALEKPLIAVDTLLGLASGSAHLEPEPVPLSTLFAPMLDARREEVWLALYDAELREIAPAQPLILENNSFEKLLLTLSGYAACDRIVLSGNGMKKLRSGAFPEKTVFSTLACCSAVHLADLAEGQFQSSDFQDIAYFEPFYMKPPNITISTKPLF